MISHKHAAATRFDKYRYTASVALEAVLELNRTPEMEPFTKIIDDFV